MTWNNISRQQPCLVHLLIAFSLILRTHAQCTISDLCLQSTSEVHSVLPFPLYYDEPYVACDSAVNDVDPSANKTCIIDYSIGTSFPSNCTAFGGTLHLINFSYPCQIVMSDGTNPYNVTYFYRNYPFCLGAECTDADAEEYIIFEMFVLPPAEPGGMVCDSVLESSSDRAAVFRVTGGLVGMLLMMIMCRNTGARI